MSRHATDSRHLLFLAARLHPPDVRQQAAEARDEFEALSGALDGEHEERGGTDHSETSQPCGDMPPGVKLSDRAKPRAEHSSDRLKRGAGVLVHVPEEKAQEEGDGAAPVERSDLFALALGQSVLDQERRPGDKAQHDDAEADLVKYWIRVSYLGHIDGFSQQADLQAEYWSRVRLGCLMRRD